MRGKRVVGAALLVCLAMVAAVVSMRVVSMRDDSVLPVRPWVMGYYVGYLADELPLDDVQWSALTHIAVGVAQPRPDGSLQTDFQLGEKGPAWARGVVDRAHERQRRAVLMIGGADTRAAFLSATSGAHRRRFVDEIVRTADFYGFDGVDIDWEPVASTDAPALLNLGKELKSRRPDLELSAALGPANTNDPGRAVFPDLAEAGVVFDRLNLMTYGMNGGWEGWNSWHSSALFGSGVRTPMSVDSTVRAYRGIGIPAEKLGLGIGSFGSCMRGATAPGQSAARPVRAGDDNALSYANIMQYYHHPARARWDDVAAVPYLSDPTPFGPLRCTYLSYEDERSIAAKADYARRQGLGGAIIWNLNLGHLPRAPEGERDPLAAAARRGFLGE